MDLVTCLRSLAEAKASQTDAWVGAQGVIVNDYNELVRQIQALSFGRLDSKLASLKVVKGAEPPEEIIDILLNAIKNTAIALSGVKVLSTGSFSQSSIVYFAGNSAADSDVTSAFQGCKMLMLAEGLTLSDCAAASNLFQECSLLRRIEFTSAVNPVNADNMFRSCGSLNEVEFPDGSLRQTTSASYMFDSCTSLTKIAFPDSALDSVANVNYMFNNCSALTSLKLPGSSKFTGTYSLFGSCPKLESIDMDFSRLSETTGVYNIIGSSSQIKAEVVESIIGAITWSKVTNAQIAFYSLNNISVFKHPETSSLTNAKEMFSYSRVQSVEMDMSHVAFSGNLMSWPRVFRLCSYLTDVTLVGGLASLIQAGEMFYGCGRLSAINGLTLPSLALTTEEYGTNGSSYFYLVCRNIFAGCSSLTDCELGGTLYKSGVDLRPCAPLSARSLYTWVDALYDWAGNPEGKTTDDTDHTLYLSDAQQTRLLDYSGDDGESGEEAYLTALDRGWTISA